MAADNQGSEIQQLQRMAMDTNCSVSSLLRQAKVIADRLGMLDKMVWIDAELNGYMDKQFDDLPSYRRLTGEWQGFHTYTGWRTIHFETVDLTELATRAPIGLSIPALEADYNERRSGGTLAFAGMHSMRANLIRQFQLREARLILQQSEVWAIIETVRTAILDWTLDLQRAGGAQHGVHFTTEEQAPAAAASHTYISIQNVGVLGDVGGNVQNMQTASLTIDVAALRDAAAQASAVLDRLPPATASELKPVLDEIQDPATPESSMGALAASARRILEGASGNLVAAGLASLLDRLFG